MNVQDQAENTYTKDQKYFQLSKHSMISILVKKIVFL